MEAAESPEMAIRNWFSARLPNAFEIALDFDLIEHRAIDSLQFMEFLMLLEQLAGREIPVEEMTIDKFRTLGAILETFFSDGGEHALRAGVAR
jgi:acyl carrier protein